jgi:hypothetical protein
MLAGWLASSFSSRLVHSRVLVPQLVVEVLADLLEDVRGDLGELHLAELRLREAACTRQ